MKHYRIKTVKRGWFTFIRYSVQKSVRFMGMNLFWIEIQHYDSYETAVSEIEVLKRKTEYL